MKKREISGGGIEERQKPKGRVKSRKVANWGADVQWTIQGESVKASMGSMTGVESRYRIRKREATSGVQQAQQQQGCGQLGRDFRGAVAEGCRGRTRAVCSQLRH